MELALTKEQGIIEANSAHYDLVQEMVTAKVAKEAVRLANFSIYEANKAHYKMFCVRQDAVRKIEKAMSQGATLEEMNLDRRRLHYWRKFQNIHPADIAVLVEEYADQTILTDQVLLRMHTESTTPPPEHNHAYFRGKIKEYLKKGAECYDCPESDRKMFNGWLEVLDG